MRLPQEGRRGRGPRIHRELGVYRIQRLIEAGSDVEVVELQGASGGYVAFVSDGEVWRCPCLAHETAGAHGLAGEAAACGIRLAASEGWRAHRRALWRERRALVRFGETSLAELTSSG